MNSRSGGRAQAEACALPCEDGLLRACEAHYRGHAREGGVETRCKMWLPAGLEGKRVLDVGCRKGKGVFKLAEAVGPDGFVMGVDWNPSYIERARTSAPCAAGKCGVTRLPADFAVAYPERLVESGVGERCFDIVVANSVLNAAYSLEESFREIARVLAPGGLLHFATVIAQSPPDDLERKRAAAAGDVVGSAFSQESLLNMLKETGFEHATCADDGPLDVGGEQIPGFLQAVVSARSR